jgi:hypothetical protein
VNNLLFVKKEVTQFKTNVYGTIMKELFEYGTFGNLLYDACFSHFISLDEFMGGGACHFHI